MNKVLFYDFSKKIMKMGAPFLALGLLAGFLAGFFYERKNLTNQLASLKPVREGETGYKFIHPLLTFVIPNADSQRDFAGLKGKIENLVVQEKNNKQAERISVYFQALDEGRWVGIGEDEKYDPASLLKVVVMIAYLKKTESEANFIFTNFTYTEEISKVIGTSDINDAPSQLQVGQKYSVDDLLRRMIVNSDNGAKNLLIANIDNDSLLSVYNALDVPRPNSSDNYATSPRVYSFLFRILYNATYVSRDLSEAALTLLSGTEFDGGLVAGVPKNTVVSHKFGQHVLIDSGGKQTGIELHDCGIIYYAKSPYFLCVMTQGQNLDSLKSAIKDISALTYSEFSKMSD